MYDNPRYISKGVRREIPRFIQNILWYHIDLIADKSKNPFSVFKLYGEDGKLKIVRLQEEPTEKVELVIESTEIVCAKVFVLDSNGCTTMALAEEY